jgi:hypothetical protein
LRKGGAQKVRAVRKRGGEGRGRRKEGASLYLLSESLLKVGSDDKGKGGLPLEPHDSFAKALNLSPEDDESGNAPMDQVAVRGKSFIDPVSVETGYKKLVKVHGVLYTTVA